MSTGLTEQTERRARGARLAKRILAGLLAAGMVLSATACGSKEVSVTLEANLEEVGVTVKETRVLEGKGDTLSSMQETLEVDLSSFTAEQKAAAVATYEAMKDGFQAIEGVACVGTDNGNGYTLELSVDCSGDVGELLNQGIIEGGETNGSISIKELQSILEDSGYTVAK